MLTLSCENVSGAAYRRDGRHWGVFSAVLVFAGACASFAGAQTAKACPRSSVTPIAGPSGGIPTEAGSAAITKYSFIVYGDTRGQYDGQALQPNHQKVLEAMLAAIKARAGGPEAVRLVLQTGDAVTDGRVAAQWNVSYTPLVDRLTVEADIPLFLGVGNHDVTQASNVGSGDRINGLCNYFAATAKLIPQPGSAHRLPDYPTYGFGFANTFFLTFDADVANATTQFFWVKSELEHLDRKRYPNVVVFLHQPPISSGPHGGPRTEPAAATLRTFYMPLFRQHHVRLLLAGHEHFYEHWVERYHDSAGDHRLDEIVTGGGGAPTYMYTGEPDLKQYLDEGSPEHLTAEHLVRPSHDVQKNPLHFVVVTVDGDAFRLEVVGVDGGSAPGKGFAPYDGRATLSLSDSQPLRR